MAIRLTKTFGSNRGDMVARQLACDLAAARNEENKIKVRRQHVPTSDYLFTTLTVTDDGYCCEWCTSLCATTPSVSS
jgi:hypothetical protein